jgi:hypothetical protein
MKHDYHQNAVAARMERPGYYLPMGKLLILNEQARFAESAPKNHVTAESVVTFARQAQKLPGKHAYWDKKGTRSKNQVPPD